MIEHYKIYGVGVIFLMLVVVGILIYLFGWNVGGSSVEFFSDSEIDQILNETFKDL